MEETIEQKVARVILEKKSTEIQIGDTVYDVAPATPATIIMISEIVSQIPQKINPKTDDILKETLRNAKYYGIIGKIAAVLILGAKRIKENRFIGRKEKTRIRFSFRRFRFIKTQKIISGGVSELDYVTGQIMDNIQPKILAAVIAQRLADMQIGDFFGITTSLSAINIIKPTKEVVETVSGESSSDGQKTSDSQ
jgi:hypothetical protein